MRWAVRPCQPTDIYDHLARPEKCHALPPSSPYQSRGNPPPMPWILHSSYGQEKGCDPVPIVAVGSCDHQEHLHMISAQRARHWRRRGCVSIAPCVSKGDRPKNCACNANGNGNGTRKAKATHLVSPFSAEAQRFHRPRGFASSPAASSRRNPSQTGYRHSRRLPAPPSSAQREGL